MAEKLKASLMIPMIPIIQMWIFRTKIKTVLKSSLKAHNRALMVHSNFFRQVPFLFNPLNSSQTATSSQS